MVERTKFSIGQLEDYVSQAIGLVKESETGMIQGEYHAGEFLGERIRGSEKVNDCIQAGVYTVMEQAAKELSDISNWDDAEVSLSKMNIGLDNIDDVATISSISRLCVVINDQAEQRNKENVQNLSRTLVEITSNSGEFWRKRCEMGSH